MKIFLVCAVLCFTISHCKESGSDEKKASDGIKIYKRLIPADVLRGKINEYEKCEFRNIMYILYILRIIHHKFQKIIKQVYD